MFKHLRQKLGRPRHRLSTTADPLTLRKVEAMREQIKLPVADSYNNLGAIAATNNDYSDAVTLLRACRRVESVARGTGL